MAGAAETISRQAESDSPVHTHNIRILYIEIAWASIMGAIVTFNSAYAIRLASSAGATEQLTAQLNALLTSIPAAVAAIVSIPSAAFVASRQNRNRWIFGSLLTLRLAYIVMALIPLLFTNGIHAAQALVVWVILLNVPAIFFTNGFQALLSDVIPERRRPFVMSRRSIIWATGTAIVSVMAGRLLDSYSSTFPQNYQIMYLIGWGAALTSSWFVTRIVVSRHSEEGQRAKRQTHEMNITARGKVRMSPQVRRMLMNLAVYHIGLTIAGPLFNVYYINQLKVTDTWLGINSAAASAGVIMGYLFWERVLRRRTYESVMKIATGFTWVFPVGVALFPNLFMISFFNFVVNFCHAGVDLSNYNLLVKLSTPANRPVVMSWFNAVINSALFLWPLVGVALSGSLGIPAVMIVAGIARIAGSVLFNLNAVRAEESPSQ